MLSVDLIFTLNTPNAFAAEINQEALQKEVISLSPIELMLLERELRKSSLKSKNRELAAEKVEALKKELVINIEDHARLLETLQQIVEIVKSEGAERWGLQHDSARKVHGHKSTFSIVSRLYRKEKFISQMRVREE